MDLLGRVFEWILVWILAKENLELLLYLILMIVEFLFMIIKAINLFIYLLYFCLFG